MSVAEVTEIEIASSNAAGNLGSNNASPKAPAGGGAATTVVGGGV